MRLARRALPSLAVRDSLECMNAVQIEVQKQDRPSAPSDAALLPQWRELADRALSRTAGAPLIGGNQVRLLRDAQQNYPAWLEAIHGAKRHIHFESYIIRDDSAGREFAEALTAKAQAGVSVRLLYDWMGAAGKTSRRFWRMLRQGGVEVRCFNPPRFESPFGWLSRDHRKTITVDGEIGFVSGLCVGQAWVGDPARNIDPWRDTGIEIRGNALAAMEQAFLRTWEMAGGTITESSATEESHPAGDVSLRIVATEPATAGMLRLDELVAALARNRLWLTDAYYAGTTSYVQALRAAARDGVDVRLLVPNGTDIPLLRPLSRAGYRPLLQAGVRIFEWNGTMLHAKTAVADGRWARVGSTNLNVASWFGNCELDAVIEDDGFAAEMEAMYLQDLQNATEVVLDERQKVRAPGEPRHPHPAFAGSGGSAGRAAAGAVRIGNAVGAAFTSRRELEPVEARISWTLGAVLAGLAILFAFFPRVLAYPAGVLFLWIALALAVRGYKLRRKGKQAEQAEQNRTHSGSTEGRNDPR